MKQRGNTTSFDNAAFWGDCASLKRQAPAETCILLPTYDDFHGFLVAVVANITFSLGHQGELSWDVAQLPGDIIEHTGRERKRVTPCDVG